MVTGDRGYIGSVLVEILQQNHFEVIGYDIDYNHSCDLFPYARNYRQITKDIRDINLTDLDGIDAIIHLAALSNDQLGELSPGLTEEINLHATISLARLAKSAGIKRFIYASSQSIYGISKSNSELEEDSAAIDPITAYAKSKWEAECFLKKLVTDNFTVVCFRPATVFGLSPRLRTDIIFNNFLACAYLTKKIEIKSDGTPWRPLIHVRDLSHALMAGIVTPSELVNGRSYNVGLKNGNYTVKEIAQVANELVPGSNLVFTGEHGTDSRTYKVSFARIYNELSNFFNPEWTLEKAGLEMLKHFNDFNLNEEFFRGRKSNRLLQIKFLIENRHIDENLRRVS